MALHVVLADPLPEGHWLWQVRAALPPTVTMAAPGTDERAELLDLVANADALAVRWAPADEALLAAAPRLRLIQKWGRLLTDVDLAAAGRRGVAVATAPLLSGIAVAEHTILLLMAFAKQFPAIQQALLDGANPTGMQPRRTVETWVAGNWVGLGPQMLLAGKTIGIVGLGEIGYEVARRARAHEMGVVYWQRRRLPTAFEAEIGVHWATLDDLLQMSDVVSLHVPQTPATEGLIGEREIDLMKRTAYLINTARGAVVDEAALIRALQAGRIAGAGLDAFVLEPLPMDSPLRRLPNVILTPHRGGALRWVLEEQMELLTENFVRLTHGDPLARVVATPFPA
ncbi:MAG: D-glycerate dehydrogenase [Chloroflexi bacterium]|nr:D-glycerate dehydrogenase [Chloroflexota bacterium]